MARLGNGDHDGGEESKSLTVAELARNVTEKGLPVLVVAGVIGSFTFLVSLGSDFRDFRNETNFRLSTNTKIIEGNEKRIEGIKDFMHTQNDITHSRIDALSDQVNAAQAQCSERVGRLEERCKWMMRGQDK